MGINPAMEIEISRVSVCDVDLFSEWEIRLGWDIKSTQMSAGSNEIRFDHFAFPELLVVHFCSKQSMHNVFALPDGIVVFLIGRAKLPLVWGGRQLLPTLMAVVGLDDSPDSPKERAPAPHDVQPVIELDKADPTYDLWKLIRDDLSEGREPGPIDVQRTWGGFGWQGIPTFFRLPVALTPEDLEAG